MCTLYGRSRDVWKRFPGQGGRPKPLFPYPPSPIATQGCPGKDLSLSQLAFALTSEKLEAFSPLYVSETVVLKPSLPLGPI